MITRFARFCAALFSSASLHAELRAGAARVEITDREVGLVNDSFYEKALVLKNEQTTVALITLDAVAVEVLKQLSR